MLNFVCQIGRQSGQECIRVVSARTWISEPKAAGIVRLMNCSLHEPCLTGSSRAIETVAPAATVEDGLKALPGRGVGEVVDGEVAEDGLQDDRRNFTGVRRDGSRNGRRRAGELVVAWRPLLGNRDRVHSSQLT